MENNHTDYTKSVTAVVIHDHKVLLARHTYGSGKGMLIIPGGYVEYGELPQDAVKREYLEETGVVIEPSKVISIRFNKRDWYVAFLAGYISGTPRSDGDENDEVIWLDVNIALTRDDVPDLTKKIIECALNAQYGLKNILYTDHNSFLYGTRDIC